MILYKEYTIADMMKSNNESLKVEGVSFSWFGISTNSKVSGCVKTNYKR